jgi:uncharacterized protein involved in propanediol utilization
MLGRVATMSASICQRHLPKPRFETVLDIAQEYGACGVQVAHSGTLVGILLDANQHAGGQSAVTMANALREVGFRNLETFALNAEGIVAT